MKNPYLANTFREIAKNGKKGFYEGKIAEEIVKILRNFGSVMTMEDMREHHSTFEDPISVNYRGIDNWEIPPNGQGITALMALNILEGFDLKNLRHNSPEYLHLVIEVIT
jgi:gamma-glutamyltranspeptidase/glutathione hydrolase